MSHDLPVSPVTAIPGTVTAHPRDGRAANITVAPTPSQHPLPNPSLRLDAGLGMVVLEFRDDMGKVTNSIPSQRILQAYHAHTEQLPSTTGHANPGQSDTGQKEVPDRFA